MNCGATFLRPDSTPLLCYRAAKEFVDEYERKEREQRHKSQAVPVNWSVEKDNAYHDLTEAIFKRKPLLTIQKAATTFVEICKREKREKKPKPDRAWSPAKHQAYNILLDDFLTYAHYDEIVADARRLAAVCEREEHEQRHEAQKRDEPKVGEVYRDILGNKYIVFNANFCGDNDKPYVALACVGKKGEAIITDLVTVSLEDFMNPTFKKV